MLRHTIVLPTVLAFTTVGCGLVLGLDDFSDGTPSATSSSGGSDTSSTTTSGAGGAGGAGGATTGNGGGMPTGSGGGGGTPAATCTKVGVPFDVISAADVNGLELKDQTLFVVDNPLNHVAYVAVQDSSNEVHVRVIGDKAGSPLKGLGSFVPQAGTRLGIARGRAKNGTLTFYGSGDNDIFRLDFDAPSDAIGQATLTPLPNLSCDANQAVQRLAVSFDPQGAMIYAATTAASPNPPTAVTLCYGSEAAGATVLDTGTYDGVSEGLELFAGHMAVAGNTWLLHTGADGPGASYFAYGTTAAELNVRHPFNLSKQANDLPVISSLLPALNGDGTLVLGAVAQAPAFTPASLWTGVVPMSSYGDFDATKGNVPPPELTKKMDYALPSDLPMLNQFSYDSARVISGGANFTSSTIFFYEFDRTGEVRIGGYHAYDAPADSTVLIGAAVLLGGPNIAVVWVEKSAGPSYAVRGQLLACN